MSELAAKRVTSEREIAKQGQRLERVRSVMTSFLKAQQLPKSKPLPDDETLPAKLAEHVVSLATSVKQLDARKAQRDAKAQALEAEYEELAQQLRTLVTQRGREQRRRRPQPHSPTAPQAPTDSPASALATALASASASPSASVSASASAFPSP